MRREVRDAKTVDPSTHEPALTSGVQAARQPVMPVVPVVLAGGSGSRLWPMSREQYPKQLLGITGASSLLQSTLERWRGFEADRGRKVATPLVICGDDHRFITAKQLAASAVNAHIIAEPSRRGTASALTLAAAAAADAGDSIIVAMPADHLIADVPSFQEAINVALSHAEAGAIVTLGVPPTRGDTGFGYIKLGNEIGRNAYRIERFVEKPAEELATQYVNSGGYWWNSGIFITRTSVWLETVRRLQPAMFEACVAAYANGRQDGSFYCPAAEDFSRSPNDSIDYAVMEHLSSFDEHVYGVAVRMEAGWSDLGAWDAVWEASEKDANGNVARGRVILEGATSSFAHSDGRLIACVGVSNLVVVETDDALLVADRSRVQDVKGVVERIKADKGLEANVHRKVRRPWGYYDSIDQGERFQVKRIVVEPGACLSLQLHHHRAEHWIVVRGTAHVTRGEEKFLLSENESTFIPLGVRHQLENPGKVPLEIIEVQSGAYLGEDDIVRFDDKYGRV
ncbi:MAG TPA: mannose-1-phosphate guanylyltransferase/mannose-6-phosphate isomerase [Trinickia sp.]|jgi:mannose-1-phosphate guanylyltransferase/mannose-6-phosphate isomerase|uniref:mannose-1-phosphate guanylyltransferase/mannose-6-phosphate isomerase n=1 Tax=Trinickia sp. TaxID=2571163 RepID=UPI002C263B89|nr:mannose-1-phosphate guanylyltransferase/mannose-6-phosphate isomerase [Trinickia sp.]HTI18905.1 mannose-1-phosphate guanylyltransferase/mannose-6-phosphate isomerase [Trinickia sp.]